MDSNFLSLLALLHIALQDVVCFRHVVLNAVRVLFTDLGIVQLPTVVHLDDLGMDRAANIKSCPMAYFVAPPSDMEPSREIQDKGIVDLSALARSIHDLLSIFVRSMRAW
jgi:hypothetical protein